MGEMLLALRRYADFRGRSGRQEFWLFFLFQMLIFVGWFILLIAMGAASAIGSNPGDLSAQLDSAGIGFIVLVGLWLLWILAMTIPNAAVVVRRFHDQDMSGWIGGILYALTWILNILGMWIINLPGLILLIFMCVGGTPGSNRYGPDPNGADNADIFA